MARGPVVRLETSVGRRRRSNYRKDGYHHGNLDAAFVDIGTALIDREGVEAVTLKRVSEMSGVTSAAARHHFGDKEGLLGAIAAASFQDLLQVMIVASKAGSDPEDNLRRVFQAFVSFAVRHPLRFRFMFEARYLDEVQHPLSAGLALACFDVLRLVVDAQLGRHVAAAPLFAWSIGHGLGSILGTSKIPPSDRPGETTQQVVDQVVGLALASLRDLSRPEHRAATPNLDRTGA